MYSPLDHAPPNWALCNPPLHDMHSAVLHFTVFNFIYNNLILEHLTIQAVYARQPRKALRLPLHL